VWNELIFSIHTLLLAMKCDLKRLVKRITTAKQSRLRLLLM
jgi:hypothetical protein